MNELPMIYSLMNAAMGDIGAIGKNQINTFQKYKFRGIDDVMNALYPVLIKHQLVLVPRMTDKQIDTITTKDGKLQIHALLTIEYTMFAPDGSSVQAVVLGEGLDTSDKACNKAMAVAMKYAMFQMFCIPTDEMRAADPDNYDIKIEPKAEQKADSTAVCEECGKAIAESTLTSGRKVDVKTIVDLSRANYGKTLCFECCKARKAKKVAD